MNTDNVNAALLEDLVRLRGVVMLVGAPDTGKTTLARSLLQAAVVAGRSVAYVDADIGQSTTGPPTCVSLKSIHSQGHLDDLPAADDMRFVGAINPDGVVLQQVVATAALVESARAEAELVVLDTTGAISGVVGQTLKYHKMELCKPDMVVALQRGGELDPLIGMLRRFFDGKVETAQVDPEVRMASPNERKANRAKGFQTAFAPPLQRWRVRPTVFAPTLPAGLDLQRLDRMLVGLQDEAGHCRGLGALEYSDDSLRVITNAGEEIRGLRLGSVRLDLETFETERVRLREVMFGL